MAGYAVVGKQEVKRFVNNDVSYTVYRVLPSSYFDRELVFERLCESVVMLIYFGVGQ